MGLLARLALGGLLLTPAMMSAQFQDPRPHLRAGRVNAEETSHHLHRLATAPRPDKLLTATAPDSQFPALSNANSDLAFQSHYVFQGNYDGFSIWDIATPTRPTLRASVICPGGQADVSVYKNLLFLSVEETRARVDCGTTGVPDTVSPDRMRGIRIFDIHDLDHPRQVAVVQTCRGSHTNTLIPDPTDSNVVYIYVSGIAITRSPSELAGCSRRVAAEDPNTSLFQIEIIRVSLSAPDSARIVNTPRLFADSSGNIASLWNGGNHGPGTQATAQTNHCHDITAFVALGLAAGACAGNGILLDIHDPLHPRRLTEVTDPNFAYWHSATFNNDGTKVVFSDEWGGGLQPHCRESDSGLWGADAIFTVSGQRLTEAGYYKLPVAEPAFKNCVAHNGSLIPVPGRDIMVQGWYQGGISVFDFTNPGHPTEIAFFDRGPMDSTKLVFGGQWAGYWYNGHIYGSEITRGLDILDLEPSDVLSQNEIDAAKSVHLSLLNPQNQPRIEWPPSFVLARAYLDQLARNGGLATPARLRVVGALARAEGLRGAARRAALTRVASDLDHELPHAADTVRVRAVETVARAMAALK